MPCPGLPGKKKTQWTVQIVPFAPPQIKDEAFDEAEKRFRLQERLIKSFIRDISLYLQHIRESASVKVLAAISFCDIYTDRSFMDPECFQRAHRSISDKQFTHFVRARPPTAVHCGVSRHRASSRGHQAFTLYPYRSVCVRASLRLNPAPFVWESDPPPSLHMKCVTVTLRIRS